MAADQLDPKPRDFTAARGLTVADVLKTLREGLPGTAMTSFANTLSDQEMEAVAAFVIDEFVEKQAPNTRYHTAANGWPNHDVKYGAAYPFVRRDLTTETPLETLTPVQQAGRDLYLDACATCHEPRSDRTEFESFPLSHMGQVIRDDADLVSRPSVYGIHDRPLHIAGLSDLEQRGKQLYEDNCAFCHAIDGTGKNWIGAFLEPHPRNLTDPAATAHLDGETLREVIRFGLPDTSMPAWKDVLSPEQIDALVAYIDRAFFNRSGGAD